MRSRAVEDLVSAPSTTRADRRATWWMLFFALAAIGTLWSLSIGMMGGPDEPAHTIKAVAAARGELQTGFTRIRGTAGFVTFSVPQTHVRVPQAYAALPTVDKCWLTHAAVPIACAPRVGNDTSEVASLTYVGTYPPLYYVLAGWPSRLLSPSDAVYAMRICSALLCASLLTTGLLSAARLGRTILIGAALSITPTMLFLTGCINPAGVEIAAAFCVWLALLELLARASDGVPTRALVRFTVASLVLAGMRPLSVPFLATIVVVVCLLVGNRPMFRRLWGDIRARVAAGVVVVFAALSALYVVVNHSVGAVITFGTARPSRLELARTALHLTGTRLDEAVGVLAWEGPGATSLPHVLIDGWIVATLLFVCVALVIGGWRERAVVLATVAGCIALPIAAQATSNGGAQWQGRYGLPLLVGLPIVAGWVIDRSTRIPRVAERIMGTTVVFAIAATYVAAHQQLMTRNVVGLPNSLFAGLSRGVWTGPGSPGLLAAWALAGSLGYAAVMTWLLHDPARCAFSCNAHATHERQTG